ncbi:class II fructose-bisphosphate aldolase [bacterium]|nr:class II fructose-bisphosphate aldolase [bacterium]
MLAATNELLLQARQGRYAVGAFNVYNLEGALAVVQAAEQMASPVIIQMLPAALALGGSALAALCLAVAEGSRVPVAVHLDHCASATVIDAALAAGIVSIMADGSAKSLEGNIEFTRRAVVKATAAGGSVEGELGWLSGEEDGAPLGSGRERLTEPKEARYFVEETGVAALAVCIGNVHGRYRRPVQLDFQRLNSIAAQVQVPLVLHGTSGLPADLIDGAIDRGICKFNVNTELRNACLQTLATCMEDPTTRELMPCMQRCIATMREIACAKITLFRSAHRAALSSPEQSTIRKGEIS